MGVSKDMRQEIKGVRMYRCEAWEQRDMLGIRMGVREGCRATCVGKGVKGA